MYNSTVKFPRVRGRCDADGASLTVRNDDRGEAALQRLRIYSEQISPIVDHYARRDCILDVNGDRPVEEVTAHILKAIRVRRGSVDPDVEGARVS
jgi:adenylate kinase